jgi:hypothetical protein
MKKFINLKNYKMKKNNIINIKIFVSICILLQVISCTVNDATENNSKSKLNYFKKIASNSKESLSLKSWFNEKNNSTEKSSLNKTSSDAKKYGDTYLVTPEFEKFEYIGVEFFDALNLNSNYKVRNYLLDITYKDRPKSFRFVYIQREISYGNLYIFEMVSAITGKIVSYSLNGISEEKYLEFRKKYYSDDSYSEKKSNICFTTFKACIDNLNLGLNNPLDQAICDFLPCNTIVYVTCTFAELEGMIEESDCFNGCNYCDVIYGEIPEM